MYEVLYAYSFGTIGFLDMLDKFEEILGIEPPQTGVQSTEQNSTECCHLDGT